VILSRFSIGLVCAATLLAFTAEGVAEDVLTQSLSDDGSSDGALLSHGSGDDALPGILRTDSAGAFSPGISLSINSSYGFSGKTLEAGDTHHRGAGRLALAYALSSDLAFALRIDGRYDKHFLEAGRDDGWVGDPRLLARYRHTLSPSLSAGVQLGLWAPGSNAPSIELDALSVEAVAAITWSAASLPLQISANTGYRIDRSAASVSEAERLSLADRMSLGVSDYNAVLAAVGVSYEVGPVEALAEWSLDLLHGSGAPTFRSSPMRIALGARHELSNGWSLFGVSEFRVSKVLAADVAEELLPFDPRVSVLAGLQLHFGGSKAPTQIVIAKDIKEPDPDPIPNAIRGPIAGRVTSGETPLVGATLLAVDAKGIEHTVISDADGAYALENLAVGEATLKVAADGHEDKELSVEISAEGASADIDLQAILPPGQLRGRVRSFRGQGLTSKLTVEPGSTSIDSDTEGNFELDLPPGDYEVTIEVEGFKAQTRKIRVDENGVTIMNVDMRKGDRKRGSRR